MERLPKSEAAKVITYQLLKSSSSVGANYRASNRATSKADFINKIKIVLEEADESNFWLTFISDVELLKNRPSAFAMYRLWARSSCRDQTRCNSSDRKSTRLNSSHGGISRMPSSA